MHLKVWRPHATQVTDVTEKRAPPCGAPIVSPVPESGRGLDGHSSLGCFYLGRTRWLFAADSHAHQNTRLIPSMASKSESFEYTSSVPALSIWAAMT